tara:strand:+ start:2935 stop:3399 length:465 start_codon:yes stop_codon:yes gene_type:complete
VLSKKKKTLKCYITDIVVMGTVSLLVFGFMSFIKPVSPFSDVKIVGVAETRGGMIVSATFIEGPCAFRAMSVYGEKDGSQSSVDWVSLDGKSNTYDKTNGKQHLVIKVYTFDKNPEAVVLMTHYDCPKTGHVYKQFARVVVGEYIGGDPLKRLQ